jgi:transcriptional regulator GlxA family with amidase domain
MLKDTNIPLQRVAAACGFGNVKAMRRALLRHVGTGPNEYRRQFRYRLNTARPDPAEYSRHFGK